MAPQSASVTIILLAAGSSSRMGEPKQLLKVENDLLICKSAGVALQSEIGNVIVILGHQAEEVQKALANLPVTVLVNQLWESGMGSSIKCGVSFLKNQSIDACLIMTCDQPLLQPDHLRKLVFAWQREQKPVVASHYGGSLGIPALFDRSLFERLLQIDDQQGAKKVIQENSQQAVSIEFPEGNVDLDTPQDYRNFLDSRKA